MRGFCGMRKKKGPKNRMRGGTTENKAERQSQRLPLFNGGSLNILVLHREESSAKEGRDLERKTERKTGGATVGAEDV